MHILGNNKLLVTCVISGIVIIALMAAYVFVLRGIIDAKSALIETASRIADEEQNQHQAVLAAALLKNRSDDIARIRGVLVDSNNPLSFIERLEEVGRLTHTVAALTIDDSQKNQDALAVHVTIEGDEGGVMRYLKAVELLPYALSVDEIDFQRLQGNDSTLTKNAKIPASHRLTLLIHVKSI